MIKMSLSRFKVLVKNVQCLKRENVTFSGFKMRFSLIETMRHLCFFLTMEIESMLKFHESLNKEIYNEQ